MHPAAGGHALQGCRLDSTSEAIRESDELELRVSGEAGIQRPQEVVTVEGIVLPGIFAVECDEHSAIRRIPIAARQLGKLVGEIVRGIVTVPGGIGEANQIRQGVIAEEATQLRLRQSVRLVV